MFVALAELCAKLKPFTHRHFKRFTGNVAGKETCLALKKVDS